MTNRFLTRFLLSGVLIATMTGAVAPAASAGPAAPDACTWTRTVLPLPSGALTGGVDAADGTGGYAGSVSYGADSEQGSRAVRWKNGQFTEFGNLDDPEFQKRLTITGVNNAGTVVGIAYQQTGFRAAIRSRDGRMERLPELPGAGQSMAEGVNDKGDIVGAVETMAEDGPFWHPVIWPADAPGTVVELTGLPGTRATADGIDEDGTVLVSVEEDYNQVPYLWRDGVARRLPLPEGAYDVITRGISNGRVIGEASYETGAFFRSVLWDRDGQPREVTRSADIRGINDDGQLVGRTDDPDWREFGVWQRTTLGSTLNFTETHGLQLLVSSDDGAIAGRSWAIPGGKHMPTVWTCG
ncbi:hypothetical protein [Amycolatopsis sp. 195334CR]|uniref:hypothetical protein n=1 Tax=Amycolatopsis sp. 195334CR TaxID=2814588 RepID=UPI001A8F95D7|nr:hypothetical protein [Amycolatopsis sp. 195334CR]MBN6040249.1 hypothetical protein [Amycolatopsis sp. 195334CR]